MDPFDLPADSIKAIAAYIRASATAEAGSPPAGPRGTQRLWRRGGRRFYCRRQFRHSPTGDRAARAAHAIRWHRRMLGLRRWWRRRRSRRRRRCGHGRLNRREVTVTVTLASGEKVEGRLDASTTSSSRHLLTERCAPSPRRRFAARRHSRSHGCAQGCCSSNEHRHAQRHGFLRH